MIPMSGYEDKDTEIFGTNSLYNREVHIRAQKKNRKKFPDYLEVIPKSPYLCTRFERKTLLRGERKRF